MSCLSKHSLLLCKPSNDVSIPHHEYLRRSAPKFFGTSRGEVAANMSHPSTSCGKEVIGVDGRHRVAPTRSDVCLFEQTFQHLCVSSRSCQFVFATSTPVYAVQYSMTPSLLQTFCIRSTTVVGALSIGCGLFLYHFLGELGFGSSGKFIRVAVSAPSNAVESRVDGYLTEVFGVIPSRPW